jgi:transcriptional regulator with XRE-family HTH domain
MGEDDLPVLPGFRELAERRRELAADLAAHRRAAALSQGEVAERMGTSQPAIARLEAGDVDARLSTVERYAAAIGYTLELRLGPVPHGRDGFPDARERNVGLSHNRQDGDGERTTR